VNGFGRAFRINIFGESHGDCVGVVIDGCPAGIELSEESFAFDLKRRQGCRLGTTQRVEKDYPLLQSGVFNGKTTGTPIIISFQNQNIRSSDYKNQGEIPRPSHADFVAWKKFGGYHDYRGGGHFSGRLTTGLVAAGVIAKKLLSPLKCSATLLEVHGQSDAVSAALAAEKNKDSVGGIIECRTTPMPIGLGEPFFDSVESLLSHAMFSIPGIKGIEFGSGFAAANMYGSEFNDPIIDKEGRTQSNHSGGINGGITNGNDLVFRVVVRPTASIAKEQKSINLKTGASTTLYIQGRHDACFALRVPVVVEAMTAIVLSDFIIRGTKNYSGSLE